MALARISTIALVAGCGALGVYGAMVFGLQNGLFEAIGQGTAPPYDPAALPGCIMPFKTTYTGIAAVDGQLRALAGYFCALLGGEQGWDLRVSVYHLTVQCLVGWALLSIEGLRFGNKGRLVGWTGLMGCIFQNASYTFTVPVYLIMYLLTSPIASSTAPSAELVAASATDLNALPISILLGFVVPTILMGVSDRFSAATHYNLIALWQPFPLWQSIIHFTVAALFPSTKAKPNAADARARLRGIYRTLLALAVAGHFAVLGISLTPASAVPAAWQPLFSEVTVWSALVPRWAPDGPTVKSGIDAGLAAPLAPLANYFLQYDINGGNWAIAIWAAFLYSRAVPSASLISIVLKAAVWDVLGGPGAVATVFLWARDERVLGVPGSKKKA